MKKKGLTKKEKLGLIKKHVEKNGINPIGDGCRFVSESERKRVAVLKGEPMYPKKEFDLKKFLDRTVTNEFIQECNKFYAENHPEKRST